MKIYQDYLRDVFENGIEKKDRTGTGTVSVFGRQLRFNLEEGFPLLTTKKVHTKSIIHELLWFISGSTNIKYLKDNGVSIWDEWADENGELGNVYGKQWRAFPKVEKDQVIGKIDQVAELVERIKKDPDSRRHIVCAWNPGEIHTMALPPCHAFFQFYVVNGKLSCQLYQRSVDSFLGLPFNIASYALFVHMIAQQTNLGVGDFVWTGGDCHIYLNHFDQVREQLSREPRPLPTLKILRKPDSIFDYKYEDFQIEGYDPHPAIKAPIAI